MDLDNKIQLPNGNPIPCVLLANKVRLIERRNNDDFLFDFSVIWLAKV
jgi:hypothetical protein